MSGMGYERMYAISLYTVLSNQLHGTEVDIDVLFTKVPLISFSLIDDTPLTRHYDLKYASSIYGSLCLWFIIRSKT